jgi:hypothetical protein
VRHNGRTIKETIQSKKTSLNQLSVSVVSKPVLAAIISVSHWYSISGAGEGTRTLVSFLRRLWSAKSVGEHLEALMHARFFAAGKAEAIHGREQNIKARLADKPADWN